MRLKYLLPIFMYHAIDFRDKESKLSVSPESFDRHLAFLKKTKKKNILISNWDPSAADFRYSFAITFDDGHASCYEAAYPLLLKHRMNATFFVISDFLGTSGYMTKAQVIELDKEGFEVGSHTCTHRWLPELSPSEVEKEVNESKKALEDILGKQITSFAYPMGGLNQAIVETVQQAGYRRACATNPPAGFSWENPFTLKRIKLSRTADRPLNLRLKASGYYNAFFS